MSTVHSPVNCLMKQVKELNDGCLKAAKTYLPPWRSSSEQEQVTAKLTVCDSSHQLGEKKHVNQKSTNFKKYSLSNYDINVLSPNSW